MSRSATNKKASVLGSGLNNLGNSCYMNASLQCLFHTKPFLNYFLVNEKSDKTDDSLIMKLTSRSRQAITIGEEFK